MAQSRAIDAINRTNATSGEAYVPTKLDIENGALGATFGTIKRNIIETAMRAIGLDYNVSNSYADIMSNPNNEIRVKDRVYYPHSGVGNLRPYNESGNPSGGCFSLYTMG